MAPVYAGVVSAGQPLEPPRLSSRGRSTRLGVELASGPVLQAGVKAPNFELPDQNGDPVKLSDLKGQTVVLYFYPADTPINTWPDEGRQGMKG
jgi:AhpC/TSA family